MLCVLMLAANCKKDETTTPNNNNPAVNTTNYAMIDSVKIPFTNAVVIKVEDDYFYPNGIYQFDLFLSSQPVQYNQTLDAVRGTGNGVLIKFRSRNKTYFQDPNYVATNGSTNNPGAYQISYYSNRNFFMGSGDPVIFGNTGTGSVTLTNNIYEVKINCKTMENKTLIVYYKGTLPIYISKKGLML